jgi:hypothetical protein
LETFAAGFETFETGFAAGFGAGFFAAGLALTGLDLGAAAFVGTTFFFAAPAALLTRAATFFAALLFPLAAAFFPCAFAIEPSPDYQAEKWMAQYSSGCPERKVFVQKTGATANPPSTATTCPVM